MPMTEYSGSTNIIAGLGTTPQERGLTEDQFKAKFDEGLTAFVTWFNSTHKTEFETLTTNNPKCGVYHNTSQSIPNDTLTAVAFNTELFDDDTMHDNATNNSRITIKTAGIYSIKASVQFDLNATGVRTISLRVNGTTYISFANQLSVGGSDPTNVSTSRDYTLAVNDYIEVVVKQTSGVPLSVTYNSAYSPMFSVVKTG